MSDLKSLSRRSFLKIGLFSSGLTFVSILSSCDQPVDTFQQPKPRLNSALDRIAKVSPRVNSSGEMKIANDYIYAAGNHYFVMTLREKNNLPALNMLEVHVIRKETSYYLVSGVEKKATFLIHPRETIQALYKIDKYALKKSFIAGKR